MLMLLVASSDPAVGDVARRTLEGLGFRVVVAADPSPAVLEFDFQNARYAVIALVGAGPLKTVRSDVPAPHETRGDLFAAIIQGADTEVWIGHSVQIELDDDGRWVDRLIEDLALRDWLA